MEEIRALPQRKEITKGEDEVRYICGLLEKKLGEQFWAECRMLNKNNGVRRLALLIRREGEDVVPCIYLEDYLEELRAGRMTAEEVAEELEAAWRVQRSELQGAEDNRWIASLGYEDIKDRIVFRVVHYGRNRELLEEAPCVRFLDLAITFHVVMVHKDGELGMFLIHYGQLKQWGMELADLKEAAFANTPRLFPVAVRSMADILDDAQAKGAPWAEGFVQPEPCGLLPMYVLSNRAGLNGASVVFYRSVLKELAALLEADLYLLPSSIHEFIAVPEREGLSGAALREMVAEVNGSQVAEEEILSEEVYYYDRMQDQMRSAPMH